MALYSALLNGAALLAQILPYGVFEQPAPIAQKGGQKKSIALDQTGYGAIRRIDWGPLNRIFPDPYPP